MTAIHHLSHDQFGDLSGWDAAPEDDTDYDYYTREDGSNDWDPDGDLQAPHYHPTASPEVRRHAWAQRNSGPLQMGGARRFR